jgi:hypothetical protein
MNAERCVLCGKVIPEGIQVCPICVKRVEDYGCPTGYVTAGDIARLTDLRGWQIGVLMQDYGTTIAGKQYIRFDILYKLRESGLLVKYRNESFWNVKMV